MLGDLSTSLEIEKFKWYSSEDGMEILSNTLKHEVVPYCLKNKLIKKLKTNVLSFLSVLEWME